MKHILLIEDETDHADLIQRALAEAVPPFKISLAENLAAARALAARELPDLALVDYRLPDGSGYEFVAWAADRFPVILLTAFGNERTAVEAIKAGALDYVIKSPEMFADVAHLVERSLREWKNQHERKQADSRLEAINHLLATMGPDFTGNIARLIELLAQETGAQMVFYSQVSGKKLRTVAAWEVARHLPGCAKCGCSVCEKILQYAAGHLQDVETARQNPDSPSLFFDVSEFHTHLGQLVRRQNEPVGVICLFFDRPHKLTTADRRLLGILASALGAEEHRKRTDDELRAMDSRYRQIIQMANEGIWVSDEQDRLTFVNQRMADLLGYSPAELMHRPVRDFVEPTELADHEFKLQLAHRGQSTQFERRLRRQDGNELLVWMSGSPLFDDDGNFRGAFAMLTDLTERRALESQLRQVQKLESIGQLAGGVAHDFNNILAAIMMHLSLLHQNPNLDLETTEAIKDLESETKRAANLTRQLLMFSRRSVMQVRPVDMNDVVQNMLKMLRRLLGEHISIKFESQCDLPPIEADIGMLEQVLMNLAVNARDAMAKGGSLTIATTLVVMDVEATKLNSERRLGNFVNLAVTDTGVGMDAVILKRIFEPFFTTKEIGKGTGLGLPTIHGIVKQHQGWIEVQSQPGRGTTFQVYLPVQPGLTLPLVDPHAAPLQAPRGHGTLLLVEDEEIVRRPIGIYLRKLGYCVLEAANGNQAFELWREHRDQVDLLYTDMVMPEGLNGLELAEQMRVEKPGLKVIISSGYSTEISNHGVPAESGFFYLAKPSPSALIAATVRDCLQKK